MAKDVELEKNRHAEEKLLGEGDRRNDNDDKDQKKGNDKDEKGGADHMTVPNDKQKTAGKGEDENFNGVPVDRGFSWVICLCAFSINFSIFGHNRCLSALLVDIKNEFQQSQTMTSLTFTCFAISMAVSSQLAGNIILRFVQPRTACVTAAITSSTSVFVASFAPNIGVWLMAYVCRGLSCGIQLVIPLSLIGHYFKRRRALASSITSMGMVVANISLPPLATFLQERYGLRGALLLISCIELQMIPFSMLLRSPESYKAEYRRKQKRLRERTTYEKPMPLKNFVSVEIEPYEKKAALNTDEIDYTMELKQKQDSSKVYENTLDESALYSSSAPAGAYFSTLLSTSNHCDTYNDKDDNNDNDPQIHKDYLNHNNARRSEMQQRHNRHLPVRMLSYQENPSSCRRLSLEAGTNNNLSPKSAHYNSQMSIAALGSLADISYTLPVDKDQHIDDDRDEDSDDEKSRKRPSCNELCRLETFFDLDLCRSWLFRMLAGFMSISSILNFLTIYLPVFANMAGISRNRASLLLSLGGGVDLITRFFVGWFADKNIIAKEKMIAGSLLVVAVVTQFGRFYTTFPLFVMFVVLNGIFSGFRANLYNAVIFDEFGPQRAPKAFGFSILFVTVAMAINHPMFGAILDATGHYTVPFHFIGACVALGAFLLLLKPVFVRWDRKKSIGMNRMTTK